MSAAAQAVHDALKVLTRHGGVVECRILGSKKGTVSGYYDQDHLDQFARDALQWDGQAAIYVTLNSVNPDLLARAVNRLEPFAKHTTSDSDVTRRAWFAIDLDPKRPAGISATDAEVDLAIIRRNDVVSFLREMGWPEPVTALSGNGAHALWPVDLPNTAAEAALFAGCLKALAARFTDASITLDQAVFNASRTWRVYGTLNVKGDPTTERPHRRAEIEHLPPLVEVERALLEALARLVPADSPEARGARSAYVYEDLDVADAFKAKGLYLKLLRDGKHAVKCPWISEHSGESGPSETVIFEPAAHGDAWGFRCQHAHCAARTIKDVYDFLRGGQPRRRVSTPGDPRTTGEGADAARAQAPPRWHLYDAAEPWDDVTPPAWIIEPLLPERGVMWVAGTAHAGKSLLVLYLCLAIAARQTEACRQFAISRRPRILFVSREDGLSRLKARRADILAPWTCSVQDLDGLRFIVREPVNLLDEDDVAELVAICTVEDLRVLVLDTWTALSPGADPDGPKDQAALARVVVDLAEAIDGLVIVIDHARKNPPADVSLADIYGPNQKAQRAEHAVVLRRLEGEDRRIEVLIDAKDLDGELRFFLDRSPMGSAEEKWRYGGSVATLAARAKTVGDENRERVFKALPATRDWATTTDVVEALARAGTPVGRSAVKGHLFALILAGRVEKDGEHRNTRYRRAAGPADTPSRPVEQMEIAS